MNDAPPDTEPFASDEVRSVERTSDTRVNPNNTQFIVRGAPSTLPNPVFSFVGNTWWAQGLTAGIVVNY